MPLPALTPPSDLVRVRLIYQNVPRLVTPTVASQLVLTKEPAEQADAGAFAYRDKLSGGPMTFTGADFNFLWAINRSNARCTPLGVQVQHRGAPDLPWETWLGSFSCNQVTWDEHKCTATVAPQVNDPAQRLLDVWGKDYNILLTPGPRSTVTAELAILAADISIEFKRVEQGDEESEYLGSDGWAGFLSNTSWIYNNAPNPGNLTDGFKERNDILFRYLLRNVPMLQGTRTDGSTYYYPVDKSASGWQVLELESDYTNGVAKYAREPGIAGFKPYRIGTYNDWNDPRNPGRYSKYRDTLLLIDSGKNPSDYGYNNADYLEVTGPDGGYLPGPQRPGGGGGANNAECNGGTSLRVRRYRTDEQCSKLYWRFGQFQFGQCFPFRDGLYSLLSQTVAPAGLLSLLPPTANQLSQFLSSTTAANQATGETGAANELPRLLLSAGSDVKRYGASEPATRLLISLKTFLADMQWWDGGWFIDPATGWLRWEHRAWLEQQQAGHGIDLRTLEGALSLPTAYTYRTDKLPRYETLVIANGQSEQTSTNAYFGKASLDYGLSGCVNQREGQNAVTFNINRLTGDVAAGVLNGDNIPDNALFVLAPDGAGRLSDANAKLSASQLLYRYWRRGRVLGAATIEGPAPQTAPNTVTGTLPVTGFPASIESIRPPRVQDNVAGKLRIWADVVPGDGYATNLADDGAQLGKATLNLHTRLFTATMWLPEAGGLTDAPAVGGRQFDDSFSGQFA